MSRGILFYVGLILLIIGCSINESNKGYDLFVSITSLPEEDLITISEGFSGITFGVTAKDYIENEMSHFYAGNIEVGHVDSILQVSFGNISVTDNYFILKLFLNYEEIMFRVLGNEEFSNKYVFFLPGGKQIEIPLVLDVYCSAQDYTYKLLAGIFIAPYSHAKYLEEPAFVHGTALNFDIILGEGGAIGENMSYNTKSIARVENTEFKDFRISTQFNDLMEIEYFVPPNALFQVRRGEVVEWSYFVNPSLPYEDWELDNFLIMAMLGFEQVNLNGKPYLFAEVAECGTGELVEQGVFTIEMPDEVGLYEFFALLVPNPTHPNSWLNFVPLEMTERFTIEVVE